ncbi:TPA: hypothetical protein KO123_001330 [Clostridioides difficile]|nr:hypothetical protein [Clostridioides difficile]HBG7231776.1 hypothetical protein [Clostridioides difficile]
MKASVKNFLIEKYNELDYKASYTCLKYHYKYNGVNVNIYFDAYDPKSLSLYIILLYDMESYYTPLNISNNNIQTEYLKDIPLKILSRILVDEHLTEFYKNMEDHILKGNHRVNSYSRDIIFVNTMKRIKKGAIDLPFWHFVRKVRMSDETLNKLSARADISREVLKEVQAHNSTLVRTDDVNKRKKLTIILGDIDVVI